MKKNAETSSCGHYRWWLQRRWADGPIVCFVMLNPSTADAENDDATIRRCIGFAKFWGFSALSVRNLFPFRATKPNELEKMARSGIDICGGERGAAELRAAITADLVVTAWGAHPCSAQAARFVEMTAPKPLWCLGTTAKGAPMHPLYRPMTSRPV